VRLSLQTEDKVRRRSAVKELSCGLAMGLTSWHGCGAAGLGADACSCTGQDACSVAGFGATAGLDKLKSTDTAETAKLPS
jgi:hypothetical protein